MLDVTAALPLMGSIHSIQHKRPFAVLQLRRRHVFSTQYFHYSIYARAWGTSCTSSFVCGFPSDVINSLDYTATQVWRYMKWNGPVSTGGAWPRPFSHSRQHSRYHDRDWNRELHEYKLQPLRIEKQCSLPCTSFQSQRLHRLTFRRTPPRWLPSKISWQPEVSYIT